MDELQKQQDSLLESVGAFRFSLQRIEQLEEYRHSFRDLIADCRVLVAAHGHKALVKKIDKLLKDTA